MMKVGRLRLAILIPAALIMAMLVSACGQQGAVVRLPQAFTYNPGANFQTNITADTPNKVVRCSVVFQVIDEAAIEELDSYNAAIRNATLIVLSNLTEDELIPSRDLEEIAARIVEQVNDAVGSHINLIVGAYFTEFVLA